MGFSLNNGADVERDLQQLVERTGVSLACARAGLRFAIELAGCTTYSLTGTWRLVSRFLEAVFAGWKMRTATGLDPTDHLIELAAKLDVDPSD